MTFWLKSELLLKITSAYKYSLLPKDLDWHDSDRRASCDQNFANVCGNYGFKRLDFVHVKLHISVSVFWSFIFKEMCGGWHPLPILTLEFTVLFIV